MNLLRHSIIVNKKLLGISVAGAAGTLFIILIFIQRNISLTRWDQGDYMMTFFAFFILVGILWTGQSFPAFRSKEKSIAYLMLPASTFEKFTFEVLTRLVAYILFMPLLFWIVANIEGAVVHHYKPDLVNYTFSFSQGWEESTKNLNKNFWINSGYLQKYLFFLIAGFTGACYFSKSPLLKTIFFFIVTVAGYSILIYLLVKGLKINDYMPSGRTILSFHEKGKAEVFFAIAATVINLTLITMSWFRFKEREA